MNTKNKYKLLLDLGMIIVLLLMYNKAAITLSFHEIAGLIVLVVMLVHVAINYKWVIKITRRLFAKGTPTKTRVSYAVNLLLLISTVVMIISSLLISKTIFTSLQGGAIWKPIHFFTAAVMLILLGIHLGLHFHFIRNALFGTKGKLSKVILILLCILVLVLLAIGIRNLVISSFNSWLSSPFTGSVEGHGLGRGDGRGRGLLESQPINLQTTFSTLGIFFSITFVFAMMTWVIEQLLNRRKKKVLSKE
ncbi:MAG: DUF4405 domain-containing protein [Sphaerochaetaceae bacterium]|jgi:hypothetical protein